MGSHAEANDHPEPEEDTSAPTGATNLDNAATEVYLVKMPDFLLDQFSDPNLEPSSSSSRPIGRLRIPEKGSDEMAKIFLDNPRPSKDPKAPPLSREYELHPRSETPKIVVFSGDPTEPEGSMRVEGRVSTMAVARPKLDEGYRRINRMRVHKAGTSQRETQHMDESGRLAAERRALRPISMMETSKEKEERRRKHEEKRRHMDVPEEVWNDTAKKMLFAAFEGQSYWSADALSKVLNEPLARLRPIINELCQYNKSGPFNGKYELKDEFKSVKQREMKEKEMEEYAEKQKELERKRKAERAELGAPLKMARQKYADD